jgi:hypothetical protein
MPIEELQEPYWEKQEGETPNQYCYFLEFLEFPTFNLKDFHDHLCEKNKKEQKGTKVVTYNTIRKWAREACNKWRVRKEAKRQSEKDDLLVTLHELDKEVKINNFKRKNNFKNKLLERLEKEAEYEKYSQLKHGVDAYVNISDDNRIDMEEPTTFANQKVDMESTNKIEYEGVENLLEVFHASKNEWNKHNNE